VGNYVDCGNGICSSAIASMKKLKNVFSDFGLLVPCDPFTALCFEGAPMNLKNVNH